jgi:hypothetical protein
MNRITDLSTLIFHGDPRRDDTFSLTMKAVAAHFGRDADYEKIYVVSGNAFAPDILPGDVASISFAGTPAGDTRVQDAYVNADAVLAGSTVTVTGHLGVDVIEANTEQRIVDPALRAAAGKRDVRAVPGPMTPAPTGVYSSSLTFDDIDSAVISKVWHREVREARDRRVIIERRAQHSARL